MKPDQQSVPITAPRLGAEMPLPVGLVSEVIEMVTARTGELVSMRRWLHARPEPSRCEHETTAAIRERLLVEGLTPRRLTCGTGLACDVGQEGPIVALRADIDALSMTEAKTVPYRSINPGACHACGHDVHAAMTIGAGLVLRQLDIQGRLPGRARLIFEPSEEAQPGGALDVIADGWLAGVSAIFGLHCDPKLDSGTLGCRVGPITSASDAIEIDLNGPGGHTARPDETVNLTEETARLVVELPSAICARLDDPRAARMVFGSMHTGSAPNVIPAEARLAGSLRTPDPTVWRVLAGIAPAEVAAILGTQWHVTSDGFAGRREDGLGWAMRHKRVVPPVINDASATEVMAQAARAICGPDSAVDTPLSWGGDTFGWYLHHVPGCYARLGTHPPGLAKRLDLHRPDFDIDERAIPFGTTVLVLAALAWLSGQAAQPQSDDPRNGQRPDLPSEWGPLPSQAGPR